VAETEYTARGVRIGRWLRSLTRAGQVHIKDGRLELLTSYGTQIDSAPVAEVRAARPWFGRGDRALASVNGRQYVLTLTGERGRNEESGEKAAGDFLEAVRAARGQAGGAAHFG
jgi:hypothetical protein